MSIDLLISYSNTSFMRQCHKPLIVFDIFARRDVTASTMVSLSVGDYTVRH